MAPPRSTIADLARRSDGVLTVRRLLAVGADRDWVDRQVARGHWQRIHRGVLVVYSGPLTWRTRARAALAYAGAGAALSHAAAAYLYEFTERPPRVLDVTIPQARRVCPSDGLRLHRGTVRHVDVRGRLVVVGRGDTVLDLVAATRGEDDAVAVIAGAVRARTSPHDVLEALQRRPRTRGASLVRELLALVAAGNESPLELRYHRDVERRHGLPRAILQRRQIVGGLWIRADRLYAGLGVRAELDGELAHPGGRTDRDTWRDNAVLIAVGDITLRYRWSHVRITPCDTALQVAAALRSRGWKGTPRQCRPGCPVS